MRACWALLLLACAPAFAVDHTITFAPNFYSPATLTINAGDRVFWTGAFASHPLRQVTGPASDAPVPGGFANAVGTSFSVTFNTPGEIWYQCTAHGLAQFGGLMRGQITVLPGENVFANGFE